MPSKLAVLLAAPSADEDDNPNEDAVAWCDSKLQEVREVLDGLLEFSDQVIEAFEITPMPAHRICFERARQLTARLRVDGASEG